MHTTPHTLEAKEKMRLAHLGKRSSPATEFKPGEKNPHEDKRIKAIARGEKHYKWTDKPSYSAIHRWVNKVLGKPKECSQCGFTSENGRQFHWANVSGQYRRDIKDWIRLCVSCHFKMDNIHARGWATRKS